MTCAPGPWAWPFLYVPIGNCEMWLFIEPLAMLKRIWPPRLALGRGDRQEMLTASGTGIRGRQKPFCAFGGKIIRLTGKRSLKSYLVLKMKSRSS